MSIAVPMTVTQTAGFTFGDLNEPVVVDAGYPISVFFQQHRRTSCLLSRLHELIVGRILHLAFCFGLLFLTKSVEKGWFTYGENLFC